MGLERLLENTPEAYYWIGFLMADGSIDTNGYANRLALFLSEKDRNHIYKFANFIDGRITTRRAKIYIQKIIFKYKNGNSLMEAICPKNKK